jgi:hypothetical protein
VRFTRVRAVVVAAFLLGAMAPAALPTPAAAAGVRNCQTINTDFQYLGGSSGGSYYWRSRIQLVTTGCWTTTQTWDKTNTWLYYPDQIRPTLQSKANGPSGPYVQTNFWFNFQATYVWTCGSFGCVSTYALNPRVYLNPSTSTTAGYWTMGSSCGYVSGSAGDTTPCRLYTITRQYTGPVTHEPYLF